jgi:hypothetical protein
MAILGVGGITFAVYATQRLIGQQQAKIAGHISCTKDAKPMRMMMQIGRIKQARAEGGDLATHKALGKWHNRG